MNCLCIHCMDCEARMPERQNKLQVDVELSSDLAQVSIVLKVNHQYALQVILRDCDKSCCL